MVNRHIQDDPTHFTENSRFTSPNSRLFPSSWCPKLDVFVLVTRIAERNHLVLRSFRDQPVWDKELGDTDAPHPEITNVCWSPDALVIVVAHGGLKLTFHSLHDGNIIKTLPLNLPEVDGVEPGLVSDMWWIKHNVPQIPEAFEDVFKRKETPASAHAILRLLPAIEQPPVDKPSTAHLFGFQRRTEKPSVKTIPSDKDPNLIPALPSNLPGASISPPLPTMAEVSAEGGKIPLRPDPSQSLKDNEQSLLVVGDTSGYLHFFLDGFYPLGHLNLGEVCRPVSVYSPPLPPFDPSKDPIPDGKILIYASKPASTLFGQTTNALAASLRFPLLHQPWTRAVARTSSTVKELLVYATSVLNEMRDGWMGTEAREGARGVGTKWLKHLESMQAAHGDGSNGDALLDLTTLLLTGRSPHSVREFFSSGGRLSERALTQWEATMTRAFAVLQEYSERKLVPALERLVIVLEEAQGWSAWTQRYKAFNLRETDISEAIKQVLKGIELAEWLAKEAEDELLKYMEFAKWFRSESLRANDGSGNELRPIAFDPLEVLDYLESGFTESRLDRWFTGSMPKTAPSDMISRPFESVGAVLGTARSFLDKKSGNDSGEGSRDSDTSKISEASITEEDLDQAEIERERALSSMTDRNLVLLLEDIVQRCLGIFIPASGAVVRRVEAKTGAIHSRGPSGVQAAARVPLKENDRHGLISREKLIEEDGKIVEYVAVRVVETTDGNPHHVYFLRLVYSNWDLDEGPEQVHVGVMRSRSNEVDFEVLDLAFFDEVSVVMLLRNQGTSYLTRFEFIPGRLEYELVVDEGPRVSREGILIRIREAVQSIRFPVNSIPPGRTRQVGISPDGWASLAVNGDRKRQVACILDERGHGEVYDLVQDVDEESESEE